MDTTTTTNAISNLDGVGDRRNLSSSSSNKSKSNNIHQQEDKYSSQLMHPISCNRCKHRHTKCDKLLPSCSYCMSNNLDCIYETPKKYRKNYLAEFVDLNQQQHMLSDMSNNLQNPKSKYKVYKFSVGEKTKKKRNRKKCLEKALMHSSSSSLTRIETHTDVVLNDKNMLSNNMNNNNNGRNNNPMRTLPTKTTIIKQQHAFGTNDETLQMIGQSFIYELHYHLNERLVLKSFRTDAYTYYTQYIAFGTTLLNAQTIERMYEFVDEEDQQTTTMQLYPEDVLSLIYAIHAVNLFVFEQRDLSFRSFEKSLRLLQYDPSSIENLILCLDIAANNTKDSSAVLCLSSSGNQRGSEVYFSSNNRDHNSLFLISSRLMLSQYCLCMGFIPSATHFLHEADIMLRNRFPIYRNQTYLPLNNLGITVDPTLSLFQGLTQDEVHVLKYRIVCGVKLDDIRFFQERLPQYIGYSTPQSYQHYTRTSSVLSDDPRYLFSSYVNKYIFGTALFILGLGKKDLLNLLLSANISLKDQPNIAFMIIGVLDFKGKLLKKIAVDRLNMSETDANSVVIPTELSHRYQDLVFTFQKIFMTSYSFLVLHEVVINYSSPYTLMNSNRNDEIDVESVKRCLNFRNEFADELSDLYAVLPDYTIHFISLVIISVFLVAKIHYDKLVDGGMNTKNPKLMRRMKNDFRMMCVLRKKFPHLFGNPQLVSFYSAMEYQINLRI